MSTYLRLRLRLALFAVSVIAIACSSPPKGSDDAGPFDADVPDIDAGPDAGTECTTPPCEETVADIPLDGRRDVDLLFVIDNSGSMAEEQASLTANFSRFVNVLENIEGGLPNVHIGVVSTNLGAAPFAIQGCPGTGDNGILQNAPRITACDPPAGRFISDIDDGAGGRLTNYTGNLADTFACIARLGIDGCGFEQPLEAMRRALDGTNPENAGFVRDDAKLAVVVLSDEDDCSVFDTNMFDTSQTGIDDPLGPLSSFRCFEFGVECNPDNPRAAGTKADCVPRADSAYMTDVTEYIDFLRALKADPNDVIVAGIIGNPTPVVVGTNAMGNPQLEPSCQSASGDAAPGVRLMAFLQGFPLRNTVTTICNEDLSDALTLVGNLVAAQLGSLCLLGDIHDADPGMTGIQPTCTVTEADVELPACDNPGDPGGSTNKPCYTIDEDLAECSFTETGLRLEVYRDGAPPDTGRLIVRCLVD
jgi:hypothetical protein